MKTEKNILIAFILNLSFSVFEFLGGIVTGSIAIISDSVHDAVDASSIGIAYFLEKKSKKKPDDIYTYGYSRFSVVGGTITTLLLLFGSAFVIINSVKRIIFPTPINYNGMITLAIAGVLVNFSAAYFTHNGDSLNQKAVNLHMLEDVLGWCVVLTGAIIMKFTDIVLIDPIMSIGVALFVLINAIRNLKEILNIFLVKIPDSINIEKVKQDILQLEGVTDVHHIHIWSMDGQNNYATMHIVTNERNIKEKIRKKLRKYGIFHTTLELEAEDECCHEKECTPNLSFHHHHH